MAHAASQAALSNAVRNNYDGQLATTAQFVAQYTAPVVHELRSTRHGPSWCFSSFSDFQVTADQLHNAYSSVHGQQAAGEAAAALSAVGPTIDYAAHSAAKSNFAQAYQVSQSGSFAANARDAYAQQAVQLAASAQAAQAQAQAHAAAYASAAKTSHVAIDAAALQAVNGINGVDGLAASNFGAGFGHGHYG